MLEVTALEATHARGRAMSLDQVLAFASEEQ